jgi:hypothetical protein
MRNLPGICPTASLLPKTTFGRRDRGAKHQAQSRRFTAGDNPVDKVCATTWKTLRMSTVYGSLMRTSLARSIERSFLRNI